MILFNFPFSRNSISFFFVNNPIPGLSPEIIFKTGPSFYPNCKICSVNSYLRSFQGQCVCKGSGSPCNYPNTGYGWGKWVTQQNANPTKISLCCFDAGTEMQDFQMSQSCCHQVAKYLDFFLLQQQFWLQIMDIYNVKPCGWKPIVKYRSLRFKYFL